MCYESDFLLFMFGRNFCDTTVLVCKFSIARKKIVYSHMTRRDSFYGTTHLPYRPGALAAGSCRPLRREIEVYGVLPY